MGRENCLLFLVCGGFGLYHLLIEVTAWRIHLPIQCWKRYTPGISGRTWNSPHELTRIDFWWDEMLHHNLGKEEKIHIIISGQRSHTGPIKSCLEDIDLPMHSGQNCTTLEGTEISFGRVCDRKLSIHRDNFRQSLSTKVISQGCPYMAHKWRLFEHYPRLAALENLQSLSPP